MHSIEIELEHRILTLDGALGTKTQQFDLQEKDYRHDALKAHPEALKGNTDILNLSRADVIHQIQLKDLHVLKHIIHENTRPASTIVD